MTAATKSRRKPRKRAATSADRALPPFTGRKLEGEVKTFIVVALAKSYTPSQVVDAVKDTYGVEITRQLVRTYNPEQCSDVAPKWVALFASERKKFRDDVDSVAISHKSVRLQSLDRVRIKAELQGNHAMVLAACEQAAKERGDVYTNRTKLALTDPDGSNPFVAGVHVTIESSKPADAQSKAA